MSSAFLKSAAQAQQGTAIITNASAGISATYARRLAQRGFDLCLVARNRLRLNEIANQLRLKTGRAIWTMGADLMDQDDLLSDADQLSVDDTIIMLVNDVGAIAPGTSLNGDVDRLEAMIQLNVVAATSLAVKGERALVARGHGTIINIASALALSPEP
jgi:short-subunit dehydrogenase